MAGFQYNTTFDEAVREGKKKDIETQLLSDSKKLSLPNAPVDNRLSELEDFLESLTDPILEVDSFDGWLMEGNTSDPYMADLEDALGGCRENFEVKEGKEEGLKEESEKMCSESVCENANEKDVLGGDESLGCSEGVYASEKWVLGGDECSIEEKLGNGGLTKMDENVDDDDESESESLSSSSLSSSSSSSSSDEEDEDEGVVEKSSEKKKKEDDEHTDVEVEDVEIMLSDADEMVTWGVDQDVDEDVGGSRSIKSMNEFQLVSRIIPLKEKRNAQRHIPPSVHCWPPSTAGRDLNRMAQEDSSTLVTSATLLKRKSSDVGWDYGVLYDPDNYDKVKCLLCGKKMSGGVSRLKQHIAGIPGQVTRCEKSNDTAKEKCRKAFYANKKKKNEMHIDEEDERMRESIGSNSQGRVGPMNRFASQINPEETLNLGKNMCSHNIKEVICKEKLDRVKEYVCRFAYEANLPFFVFELDSCKLMFEAIGQYGVGCKPPSRYEMSEPFLKKEVERTKELLKLQEEEWRVNGCSIMIDAWSDRKRRTIMNLCVNSRLGTVFISSKDFSDTPHTSQVIHDYVEKCIQEVGPENVVQVVTNNATNNMVAAKLLKTSRPQIFWTSCAAHSINLMLESIADLPRFKRTIEQAKALTIFIYAHHKTLAMMRMHTRRRDIVRPGVTRFASSFLSLQSINEKRVELRTMFTSIEWQQCKFAKTTKGKSAYTTVLSMSFWYGISSFLQVFSPLVKVLRLVDGDKKSSMGFVYGELMKAKKEVQASLNNIPKNYQPIIDIIDERMKESLNGPLHLTAYLLNPFYHYQDPLLHLSLDVATGILDCIDVLFPEDLNIKNKIMNEELPKYKNKDALFGRQVAVVACTGDISIDKFDPVNWWANYGSATPFLQRLAMRILSLTTSSSGCERNWSAFERIHAKKRNKLLDERLNNLVYVNFNAKLMNKHKKLKEKDVEVLLAKDDASYAQEWIVGGGSFDDGVVEGSIGSSSGMTSLGLHDEMEGVSQKSARFRELDEDDFSFDDEEVNVDVDFESDDEDRVYGDEQLLSSQVPLSLTTC